MTWSATPIDSESPWGYVEWGYFIWGGLPRFSSVAAASTTFTEVTAAAVTWTAA